MAAISKEPVNKSFIDIICNCSSKNSSAVLRDFSPFWAIKGKLLPSLLKHPDNDRQTFRNQYKSADAQAYLRLFLLYPFKITHEGV